MPHAPSHHRALRLLLVSACLWPGHAGAQTASAHALKAAFLYNFAKFTEWPADALKAGGRMELCVAGDSLVADALERTIEGRLLDGHPLVVRVVDLDGEIGSCHLLYASGPAVPRWMQVVRASQHAPTFTVSDRRGFARDGGVAELIQEEDRLRFAINVAAAKRARLTLSSKLLSLATVIKERGDVRH